MKISKEFKIGFLVVAVLAATFFLINYLRGSDIFGREKTLVAHFSQIDGLVESAPVHIRGYAAGQVKKVEYCPQTDDFLVECSIKKDFKVPADSKMVIESTSIMGSKGIRIDCGQSTEYVADGATLEAEIESDLISSLSESITPLLAKVTNAVDSVTVLVGNINSVVSEENKASISSSLDHLNHVLADAKALMATLNGKSDEVNTIVKNLTAMSEKLTPIAESAQTTIANVNTITSAVADADLKGTVEDLRKTIGTVNTTLDEVRQPLDSLLNDADKLIKAISENPKKYIKVTVF